MQVGQVVSHYKILEKLGSGGMGEVYKAQDLKLDRILAVKFLPSHLTATDADRTRFLQEAKAASAINHPNVCVIHDIQEHESEQFIVMEFVEGVTLKTKIQSDALDCHIAVDYAIQIAEALVAAHSKGVVHRDIKSENIMINSNNQIKVMDFGLAKLKGAMLQSKTTSTAGTLAYMAPEQIEGKHIDARADIFSFGVVLYEMLTGRLPFKGDYEASIMYAILNEAPQPVVQFCPDLSSELLHVLNRALEKEAEERYQSVKEMLIDLKRVKRDTSRVSRRQPVLIPGTAEIPHAVSVKQPPRRSHRFLIPAAIFSMIIFCIIAFVSFKILFREAVQPTKSIPFTSLPGMELHPAFSPSGDQIAFSWNGDTQDNFDIWIKLVGGGDPLRLTTHPGDDFRPAWLPDGSQIAFFRHATGENGIYIVPALGGPERKLCSVNLVFGGGRQMGWSPDGKSLIFQEDFKLSEADQWRFRNISLLSVESRERTQLTHPPAGFWGDSHCAFSPDGKTIAFVRGESYFSGDIHVVPVVKGEPRRLTFDNRSIKGLCWAPDGREMIFSSDRSGSQSLWRVSATGGSPTPLTVGGEMAYDPAISGDGQRLAYVQRSQNWNIGRIAISESKDRNNVPSELIPSSRWDALAQFSPDDKKIVFSSDRTGNTQIWTCDGDGRNSEQLTFLGGTVALFPRWSPNGKTIVFDANPEGNRAIYTVSTDGRIPKRITKGKSEDWHPSFSRDGKSIYFTSNRITGERQIWKIPVQGGDAVCLTDNGGGYPVESFDRLWVYYNKGPEGTIWKVPVQGGEASLVLDHPVERAYWDLVEDGIYYVNQKTMMVEFFDFTTEQVTPITKFPDKGTFGFDVSSDRRQILYTQIHKEESDIMLVENFR